MAWWMVGSWVFAVAMLVFVTWYLAGVGLDRRATARDTVRWFVRWFDG